MTTQEERKRILEMIERGNISAEQGLGLLQAIDGTENLPAPDQVTNEPPNQGQADPFPPERVQVIDPGVKPESPEFSRWKGWWLIPLYTGIAVITLGALWMYQAVRAEGIGLGFFLAWIPFLVGLVLIILAWQMRAARWLHLRIEQRPGKVPQTIRMSFPLPVQFGAWGLRTFGPFVPQLRGRDLDQIFTTLNESISAENPIYIHVDDEDGERVEIFIG